MILKLPLGDISKQEQKYKASKDTASVSFLKWSRHPTVKKAILPISFLSPPLQEILPQYFSGSCLFVKRKEFWN